MYLHWCSLFFCIFLKFIFCVDFSFNSLIESRKCKINGTKIVLCNRLTKDELNIVYEKLNVTNYMNDLEELTITESGLQNLTLFPKLLSLKKLDLSHNELTTLEISKQPTFRNLIYLNVKNNSLKLLSHDAFSFFPNLEEIHLQFNKIYSVDWEAFRLIKLRYLYLQNNYLPIISEHMLRFTPNLEVLDLSHNQLTFVQSSSFYTAQRLSSINLNNNRIQQFKYDSFMTLNQIQWLDLSYNNMSILPGLDLKQFVGLKFLNLSGNPFTKIISGDIWLPMLEDLRINDCPSLRLIEVNSFSSLSKLKRISISNNTRLNYISPDAFRNISKLEEINLTNNSLENIDAIILSKTEKIYLKGNSFKCECVFSIFQKYSNMIKDFSFINCKNMPSKKCETVPFLPFGSSLFANLGSCFSIYCSSSVFSSNIFWTFPNGSKIVGNQSESSWSDVVEKNNAFLPFLTNTEISHDEQHQQQSAVNHPHHINPPNPKSRIYATKEQLKFDIVMPEDAGSYKCTVGSNPSSLAEKSVIIKFAIKKPAISIKPIEIGSHFVTISWNDTLKICAYNRVSSFLTVQDDEGYTRRYTRLSLHNPWLSYNVMRLKPLQNYTICLLYVFTESGQNRNIFETCIDIKTRDSVSFWNTFNVSVLLIILGLPLSAWILILIKTLYFKLHIWHDNTIRAKMNQSISGQSFLSRSSTVGDRMLSPSSHGPDNSEGQRGVQSTQMSVLGPLIEEDGYILEYENNAAL
uniref:Ig-like domain-containing protein n=1 Tax=Panagrolaimus sp. PS1159 TaxID=55785 RepID=A0AC35GTL9_9BILA